MAERRGLWAECRSVNCYREVRESSLTALIFSSMEEEGGVY